MHGLRCHGASREHSVSDPEIMLTGRKLTKGGGGGGGGPRSCFSSKFQNSACDIYCIGHSKFFWAA